MSVCRALYWRGRFFLRNHRKWTVFYILVSVLWITAVVTSVGIIPKNAEEFKIVFEKQNFPPVTEEVVLEALRSGRELIVFPKDEQTSKLISLVTKRHPQLVVDFWNKRSDVANVLGDGALRLVFNEISPNKLDYTVFVREDMGIFPIFETPGPSAADEELIKDGQVAIQVAVDNAYMEMFDISQQDWTLRKNPYPEYTTIDRRNGFKMGPSSVWYFVTFSSVFILTRFGQQVVEEKTSGIGELLAIYGVHYFHSLISWFLTFSLVLTTMSIFHTLVMVYPVVDHVLFLNTSTWVVFLVLMTYYHTSLLYATFLSTFCTNSTMWGVSLAAFTLGGCAFIRLLNMGLRSNFVLRVVCLLPVGGLHQCITAMLEFEKSFEGVKVDNFFSQPPVNYSLLSVGESVICMVAGSFLVLLLLIYSNMVWPRTYGTAKPWYFPCQYIPRFKSRRSKEPSVVPVTTPVVEDATNEMPVALEVRQIHKYYGKVVALKGVSINIYANQITSLLGENGAGKTTLLGVITGMLRPTQGQILVNGQDLSIGNNMESFRRNIGYCPQNDLLMDYLTVQQHLVFFSLLQGADYGKANFQAFQWMAQFNLSAKENVGVSKLSGGMKRKLTLCISMVRDPVILLLDEPTSGLDPVARREVWNILYKARGSRTIILTTHRMEEADALSDHIAILSEGNLRVLGSNEFLKSKYGVKYQVSFIPLTETLKMSEELLETLQQFKSTYVVSQSDKKLVLGVNADNVPELLRFVERTYGNKVGISVTSGTLNDVFLKVRQEDGVRIFVDETSMPSRSDPKLLKGTSLLISQVKLVTSKRYSWTRHKWKSLVLYILIWPVFSLLIALILPGIFNPIAIKEGGVGANLGSYGETTSLISENDPSKFSEIFKSSISLQGGTYHVIEFDQNIEYALMNEAAKNLKLYRTKMIFSVDSRSNLTVYYSSVATIAVHIAVNMVNNAMIQANGSHKSIKTEIFLQPMFNVELDLPGVAQLLKFMLLIILCTGFLESFSYFVMFPHEERTSLLKHMQLMTGLHSSIYWTVNYFVDSIHVLCGVAVSVVVFVVWDNAIAADPLFTQHPYFLVTIIILIMFGLSSISYAYVFSLFFKQVTRCMAAYEMVAIIMYSLYFTFLVLFSTFKNTGFLVVKLKYIFYLVPLIPFIESLQLNLSSQKVIYMDYSTRESFDNDESLSDVLADVQLQLIYLAVDSALFLAIVVIVDDGGWRRICKIFKCLSKLNYDTTKVDGDVLRERSRITNLGKESEHVVVVDDLTKSYRKCRAANGISFTVDKGEFFGLLGLNGAGKTTTFKMLSGLVDGDKGDARIEGRSLVRNRRKYMKALGFCPQSAGQLDSLSGQELLQLFGGLRGLVGKDLKTAVEKWAEVLDMDQIIGRNCGSYSGGNKRKLSVAMSLIGNPSVVLLDEPTTGVDPVSRCKLWSLFNKSQDLGSTFILTSHSLDESEALCDRVTIMADGYMKCLGPVGQLKIYYSAGFNVIVQMSVDSTENDAAAVKKTVDGTFHSAYSIKDEQSYMLSFDIDKKDMKWSDRFDFIVKLKSQVPKIKDVVISDSSLENVYYNVTKPQYKRSLLNS